MVKSTIEKMVTIKYINTLRSITNPAERLAFCAYTVRKYGLDEYNETVELMNEKARGLNLICSTVISKLEQDERIEKKLSCPI